MNRRSPLRSVGSSSWNRLLRLGMLALLVYALVVVVVPIVPTMPYRGADESWRLGLNRAAARQLVFGRDIVFTYGPYVAVVTQWYEPGLRFETLAAAGVFAASWITAAVIVLRRRPWWVIAFFAAALLMEIGITNRDALLSVQPLVIVLAIREIASRQVLGASPRWLRWSMVATLVAPLGLAPLVKMSMLPGSLLALIAVGLVLWRGKDRGGAIVAPIAALLTMQVAWVAIGQPLLGWWDYFVQSAPLVTGYTAAMSADEYSRWPRGVPTALFVVVAVGLITVSLARSLRDRDRFVMAVMLAATLFLAFKASFVRSDYLHIQLAAPTLLVAGPVVAWLYCRHWLSKTLVVIPSVLVAGILYDSVVLPGEVQPGVALRANVVEVPLAVLDGSTRASNLDAAYATALQAWAVHSTIPQDRPGPADLYPYLIVDLLSKGVTWSPRPVIMSYAAYTDELADLNAEHLRGPRAPKTIFWGLTPIDGRLPALDDGHSWPDMLARYRLAAASTEPNSWLRLDRRRRAASLAVGDEQRIEAKFGEEVELPQTNSGWLASFDVSTPLTERVRNLVWKGTKVNILVRTRDNPDGVVHRFVPTAAEAEFILSPYVGTQEDMIRLFEDADGLSDSNEVTSIMLDVVDGGSRSHEYTLRLRPIALEATRSRPAS